MNFRIGVIMRALTRFGRRAVTFTISMSLVVATLPIPSRSALAQAPTSTGAGQEISAPEGGSSTEPPAPPIGDLGADKKPSTAVSESPMQAAAAAEAPPVGNPSSKAAGAAGYEYSPRRPETLASGAFTERVSIEVPKFHDLEPKLSLTYSSSAGLNAGGLNSGFVGVGWRIEGLPDIVRTAPVNGTPRFDAADVYQLDGTDLLECTSGVTSPSCATGGTHAAKVESYQRISLEASSNSWVVWTKNGTRSVFKPISTWGDTADSSDDNPDLIKNRYRWLLAEHTDTHGNKVVYSYKCSILPACYPDKINYNQTVVSFEAVGHPAYQTKATGRSIVNLDQQLKRIEIRTGDQNVRAYALTHEASPSTNLQRLTKVQQYGADWSIDASGGVTGSALPPYTFSYSNSAIGFELGTSQIHGPDQDGYDLVGDFNGDHRADVLKVTYANNSCAIAISLSIGRSFENAQIDNAQSYENLPCQYVDGYNQGGINYNYGFSVADFDGDGLDDIAVYRPTNYDIYLTRNTALGLTFIHKIIQMPGDISVTSVYFHQIADFDGDGKSDIFSTITQKLYKFDGDQFVSYGNTVPNVSFDWNFRTDGDVNGDGRQELVNYLPDASPTTRYRLDGIAFSMLMTHDQPRNRYDSGSGSVLGHTFYQLGDLNGDGTGDLVKYFGGPFDYSSDLSKNFEVQYSSGRSFLNVAGLNFTIPCVSYYGPGRQEQSSIPVPACEIRNADIDGDKRSDIIVSTPESPYPPPSPEAGASPVEYFTNIGGGNWRQSTLMKAAIYALRDFDGDGKTDILVASNTNFNPYRASAGVVYYATGEIPDLLRSVTSPLGGITEVEYTPSSAWGLNPETRMPFVVQTVSKVTAKDGRSQSSQTSYTYRGGKYDFAQRRFLGFAGLTATLPCSIGESSCPSVDVTFSQNYAAAGTPILVERRAGDGTVLRRETTVLDVNDAAVPFTALPVAEEQSDVYGVTVKTKRTQRTFNGYGEMTRETYFGDVDRTGDERYRLFNYALNTSLYIVDKAYRIRIYPGTDTSAGILTDTITLYDGHSGETSAPTKGDPTAVRRWLNTSNEWVTSYKTYDTFGNVLTEKDEVAATTSYTYDSVYNLFPVTTTNAIGRSTSKTWNAACQQPATETDLNDGVATWTYDALCRKTRVDQSWGDFTKWDYFSLGIATRQHVRTATRGGNDSGDLWSKSYFDGLGRVWREQKEGPSADQEIQTDITFDGRGNGVARTLPYYEGAAVYSSSMAYDALDRVVTATLPDGVAATTAYLAPSVPTAFGLEQLTEALGRVTTTQKDAAGNVVRTTRLLNTTSVHTDTQFDVLDRVLQITDPIGAVWTYAYDTLGRRTSVADPDLGTLTFAFDDTGRPTLQTDAAGTTTAFVYDKLGRVIRKTVTLPDGTAEATRSIYDEVRTGTDPDGLSPANVGQLTRQFNGTARVCHDYDLAGRKIRERWTLPGTNSSCEITASSAKAYRTLTRYDKGGRVTSRTYPDGDVVGHASPTNAGAWRYDMAGRLLSIPGLVTALAYNAAGKTLWAEYANGTVTEFGYSAKREWLGSVATKKDEAVRFRSLYTRDVLGRITKVASTIGREDWTYAYDTLDRLVTADNLNDDTFDQTFTYDVGGNVKTVTGVGTYIYPAASAARPHAPTKIGAGTLTWDANGNMLTGRGRTFTWDGENRPASIKMGSGASAKTTAFDYGPDGGRVRKTSPGTGSASCTAAPPPVQLVTLGSGLNQHQKAMTAASATAEA